MHHREESVSIIQPDRRQFLIGAAALGALAGMRPLQAVATPKKGGHLNIAMYGGTTGQPLDPRKLNSSYADLVGHTIYNTVVGIEGRNNDLVPELAESWNQSDKATKWVFKIRKGVTFHDGRALTADDIVWSLNLHRGEGAKSPGTPLLKDVTGIEATGTHEVTITLAHPDVEFPQILAQTTFVIVPKDTEEFNGIGTGPYKVDNYQPGERLDGKRFENYWRPDSAHADSVSVLAINDTTARINALQAGQVHIIGGVPERSAKLLEKAPGIVVKAFPTDTFRSCDMVCNMAPYDNVDLRKALKLAIDRKAILESGYHGYGDIAFDHPVSPGSPFYAGDISDLHYDPDRARHHYQKSGHSGPIVLDTSDAVAASAIDVATLFAEQAASAGIEIQVRRNPADGYYGNVWRKQPFCMVGWRARSSVDQVLSAIFMSDSTYNSTQWSNPAFDKLVREARGEQDDAKRKELYGECQRMLADTGGAIIPAFVNQIDAMRENVGGFETGQYSLCNWRAAETLWLNDA